MANPRSLGRATHGNILVAYGKARLLRTPESEHYQWQNPDYSEHYEWRNLDYSKHYQWQFPDYSEHCEWRNLDEPTEGHYLRRGCLIWRQGGVGLACQAGRHKVVFVYILRNDMRPQIAPSNPSWLTSRRSTYTDLGPVSTTLTANTCTQPEPHAQHICQPIKQHVYLSPPSRGGGGRGNILQTTRW